MSPGAVNGGRISGGGGGGGKCDIPGGNTSDCKVGIRFGPGTGACCLGGGGGGIWGRSLVSDGLLPSASDAGPSDRLLAGLGGIPGGGGGSALDSYSRDREEYHFKYPTNLLAYGTSY